MISPDPILSRTLLAPLTSNFSVKSSLRASSLAIDVLKMSTKSLAWRALYSASRLTAPSRRRTCQCLQAKRSEASMVSRRIFSISSGESFPNSSATNKALTGRGKIRANRYWSTCVPMFEPKRDPNRAAMAVARVSLTRFPKQEWMTTLFSKLSTRTS